MLQISVLKTERSSIKFKGRIGVGVITLLIIINIMGILDTLKSGDIKTLMLLCIIFFLVDLLIIDLTIRNYSYITSDGILVVRLGVFKQQIPCKDIKCIKKTRNPLAGMSLSSKRLDIRYMGGRTFISVKDESNFFEALKSVNTRIEIKENVRRFCE